MVAAQNDEVLAIALYGEISGTTGAAKMHAMAVSLDLSIGRALLEQCGFHDGIALCFLRLDL